MKTVETRVEAPQPFSLRAVALSHGWHECAPLSWCEGGACLQWITRGDPADRGEPNGAQPETGGSGAMPGAMPMPAGVGMNPRERHAHGVASTSALDSSPLARRRGHGARPALRRDDRDGRGVYRVSVLEGKARKSTVPLRVVIEGPAMGDALVARIRDDVRIMLKLDQDLSGFYAVCADHPTLRILERIGAGRTLRSRSMTENVIKTLCGTNVNWNQAVQMINRIAQRGPILPHHRHLNAWPSPAEILKAGRDYLTGVCRVGYRADSILKLCDDVVKRRFDPDELDEAARTESSDALLKRLLAIQGIGPASAHALLGTLGHYDRLAVDSSTFWHVARVHTNGRKPTIKDIQQIYEPYGRWKNLVWWFELWLEWDTAKAMLAGSRGR